MRKSILAAVLVMVWVSLFMAGRAVALDQNSYISPSLALGPVQYWKDTSGDIIGVSSDGNLIYLEMPAGYEHLNVGFPGEGYGLCYSKSTGAQPPLYDIYGLVSTAENPGGDVLPVSMGAACPGFPFPTCTGGSTPALAKLTTGTLAVTVVANDFNSSWQFKNIVTWKTGRTRLDVKTIVKNISGGIMTDVVYRRNADIDTDTGGSLGWAGFSNNFTEQSRSVWASTDKDLAASFGREAHTVGMVGFPKPTNAEVPEICCLPNDISACPAILGDNPPTPILGPDLSGVLEWKIGTVKANALFTRYVTYVVDVNDQN
jgi:hypothetical protein